MLEGVRAQQPLPILIPSIFTPQTVSSFKGVKSERVARSSTEGPPLQMVRTGRERSEHPCAEIAWREEGSRAEL